MLHHLWFLDVFRLDRTFRSSGAAALASTFLSDLRLSDKQTVRQEEVLRHMQVSEAVNQNLGTNQTCCFKHVGAEVERVRLLQAQLLQLKKRHITQSSFRPNSQCLYYMQITRGSHCYFMVYIFRCSRIIETKFSHYR